MSLGHCADELRVDPGGTFSFRLGLDPGEMIVGKIGDDLGMDDTARAYYLRTGKHEQAHEHLTTATTMYREMGMTYWLEQAERKEPA